jgi:hypothetical protein
MRAPGAVTATSGRWPGGRSATRLALPAVLAATWVVLGSTADRPAGGAPPVGAQGTPSPVPTASATFVPPSIAGEWAVTRSYARSCPACAASVVRTVAWSITQVADEVRVDRGLRGSVTGVAGGGGYLALSGTESGTEGLLRYHYGTLRVAVGGDSFEGEFAGSERVANPCAAAPPLVTCFVSAGHVTGRRVRGAPTQPATDPATQPAGSPSATPTGVARTPSPPTPTASPPTPTATAGPPSATATPVVAPPRAFLPSCAR